MNYQIGLKLKFIPNDHPTTPIEVEVIGLRKGGCAKLSNGWLADAYGVCEGNAMHKGARVCLPDEAPLPQPVKRGKYKHRRAKMRGINE